MGRIEKTVFISYRRTNAAWALAVSQHLTHHSYDVFFDFTGVGSGDFERVIIANIRARAHFLILLTPSALERSGEPDDWLRHEIETALDAKRNVVPMILEGFDFSAPEIAAKLTGTIAPLKRYNAIRVPVDYFDAAMARLREQYLNIPLDTVLHPVSAPIQLITEDQQRAAAAEPIVREEELTAQEYFERGVQAKELTEKARFYDQAISLKPDYAEALNNRGRARDALGDLAGALKDYEEAIRLKPNYVEALNNRGHAHEAQGNLGEARQDYDTAISSKPEALQAISDPDIVNYSGAFDGRTRVKFAQGDVAGAKKDLEESMRLDNALLQRIQAGKQEMDELHAQNQAALRRLIQQLDMSAECGDESARSTAERFRKLLDPGDETAIRVEPHNAGAFSRLRRSIQLLSQRLIAGRE